MTASRKATDMSTLRRTIEADVRELGFDAMGVTGIEVPEDERHLIDWLDAGLHGEMSYLARHALWRSRPQEFVPGTIRVLSVRMDYWPAAARPAAETLADRRAAYVARYALGRDYHKLMRRGLQRLADRVAARIGPFGYRVCVDSAPVLERAFARNAGLGWIGKHTTLIAREAGSWFFLGELLTDLPLPVDTPASAHCGTCSACIPACPTGAIIAPHRLDARRCISYLTIELKGSIPEVFRAAMGNRIYGCDDCQLVCPWNKFARAASHPDFKVRNELDAASLPALFRWTETQWTERMQGTPIYRLGYERWLRNIAVALGNAAPDAEARAALESRKDAATPLVREHIEWALARHAASYSGPSPVAASP